MDQLLDYWQKRNHPLAEEAANYLLEREEEYKIAVAELEKAQKAKKPKSRTGSCSGGSSSAPSTKPMGAPASEATR